ncbi:MAG: hypothetical protein WAM56_07500, partial [Acidobacteriaceae bacterium]
MRRNGAAGRCLRMVLSLVIAAFFGGVASAANPGSSTVGEDLTRLGIHDQELLLRVLLVLVTAVLMRLLFAVHLA